MSSTTDLPRPKTETQEARLERIERVADRLIAEIEAENEQLRDYLRELLHGQTVHFRGRYEVRIVDEMYERGLELLK